MVRALFRKTTSRHPVCARRPWYTGCRRRWPRSAAIPLLITAAVILLVFSSLTVEVDHLAIRLRFGVGLFRKRIALADVSSWHAVRNPWYSGWGIRLGPGGVLWNVSGFDAVELVLASGERFRVGTDEPLALATAITQAKGTAGAPSPTE